MPKDRRLSRSARAVTRAALTVFAALAAFTAIAPSSASAAALPPEGIFAGCPLDSEMSTCLQRLQVIHDGGFQVVVATADEGSPANLAAYAAQAQALGMKVVWELSNQAWWDGENAAGYYGSFASACGCTTNSELLTYMVHFFASLPATYGYYAADDSMLAAGDQAAVSAYVDDVKTIDPAHPTILSSADETQTQQYESIGSMNAAEIYPITTSSLMPVSSNLDWWGGVAQEASDDQKLANRNGKPSAFILQAFSFGDNLSDGEAVGACTPSMTQLQCWNTLLYPTPADQLQLRNEILKNANPQIILWWSFAGTYGQAGNDTYSLYPTGATASAQWAGLTAAINAPAPAAKVVAHTTRATRRHHHHRRHHHRRRHRHHRHHHRRHHRRA